MKNKQYIFCLESTSKAQTDWLYIKKVIDYLNQGKQVFDKYKPLYMEGKGNYNSKSFINKINERIRNFNGESIVIYCIDLDDYHINPKTKEFVDNVEKYCLENNYKFVYFSRDIEEVFWGKQITENKQQFAAKFSRDIEISKELLDRLNKEMKVIKTSNVINILERKGEQYARD